MDLCLELLRNWATYAEGYWYQIPDEGELGCYGTGYNVWGVQTNQKYLSAMAVLAALGELDEERRQQVRQRALSALRFSLRSHVSGDYCCTDGTRWGHTWISALGIERMMHGVHLLKPHLTDEERAALRRVLTSEADWLLHHHVRGSHRGVVADPWNSSGKNVPESNIWNGALLWRTAVMYPDHPNGEAWQERAHQFLLNGVSVAADAKDERLVAGRPLREWHVGASFFPNYALDHHGYLNVGYMVICLSNAAMLHFDLKALGLPAPESLHHHQADLWQVVRRMVFADGRLARIGGDSRVRYAYCQEYLLPALLYAADHLGEEHAAHLLGAQLELIRREAAFNRDGSFYGERLEELAASSPYYYTRLESDRACTLGMVAAYRRQFPSGALELGRPTEARAFEASAAGTWCDPDHGAVLHRGPGRLAAFAWRAFGLGQGTCQPPDDGHLAEWLQNLGGQIRFAGDDGAVRGGQAQHRRLLDYHIDTLDGGFATCGSVMEGVELRIEEGWNSAESAVHQLAFVALPDEHTVVGLQHVCTLGLRTYAAEIKGLHLNLPNDLYNGFERRLAAESGEIVLRSPPEQDEIVPLDSLWVHVDGRLGVVGLYGAEQLVVHRSRRRRGGRYSSLYVEEICFPCEVGTRAIDPHTVLLDAGWAVLSEVSPEQVQKFSGALLEHGSVRGVQVRGLDGHPYVVLANFGFEVQDYPAGRLGAAGVRDLVAAEEGEITLRPGQVQVLTVTDPPKVRPTVRGGSCRAFSEGWQEERAAGKGGGET